MSLNDFKERVNDLILPIVVILIGFLGFGLGRLSRMDDQKMPIRITPTMEEGEKMTGPKERSMLSGKFVAARNGTAYYFPWCSGVTRIKNENKIWFDNEQAAVAAGYRKASSCKGL